MAVKIGSARSDERGKITGGKAGDQKNGNEVSIQNWYKHSKGWRVFRCVIPEMRPLIAKFMQEACDNNNIGYDQYQRTGSGSLRDLLAKFSYKIKSVSAKCETDCSALVADCITCALRAIGRTDKIPNFNTSSLPATLLKTKLFVEMTGTKYTDGSSYLMAGDILCTKKKGHTVIVLNDGTKASSTTSSTSTVKKYKLGDRILKNGMSGADVKELQNGLTKLGFKLGEVDGKFGDKTEKAVKEFQLVYKLAVDGHVGPKTISAMNNALSKMKVVHISGGNCHARKGPEKSYDSLGTAREGKTFEYLGDTSSNGWLKIKFNDKEAWVSGKYGKLVYK